MSFHHRPQVLSSPRASSVRHEPRSSPGPAVTTFVTGTMNPFGCMLAGTIAHILSACNQDLASQAWGLDGRRSWSGGADPPLSQLCKRKPQMDPNQRGFSRSECAFSGGASPLGGQSAAREEGFSEHPPSWLYLRPSVVCHELLWLVRTTSSMERWLIRLMG